MAEIQTNDQLVNRLSALGWIAATLREAVLAYQNWHGLKPDGVAGPVTVRHIELPRFCGLPDFMVQDQTCAWPHKKITWNITGALPGMSAADQKAAYALAWSFWAEVCDIQPEYTASRAANVLMGAGGIDRAGGTLAWSELPCGSGESDTLNQKYDTLEPWGAFDVTEDSRGQIDIVRVACHEIGHVIGIPHIQGGNLLAPTYNPAIRKPQLGDIDEAVKRYGKPVNIPAPTPQPGDPKLFVFQDVTEQYRLTKKVG